MTRLGVPLALLVLFVTTLVSGAQVEPNAPPEQPSYANDKWHINVSPYLWFAGLNGNLTLAGHEAAVHQSFGDIFSNLKFGVTVFTEVRRGRIGSLTDLMFLRIGNQAAVPVQQLPTNLNVKLTSSTFMLTPYFAYRVYTHKQFSADLLAGFRYYHLGSSINLSPANQPVSVSYSGSNNWADAVGGARFKLRLTPKVGAFFIGDGGGGGSSPTWQIAFGAGYKLLKRATIELGYRRLYFDRQDEPSFAFAATQQGLILGVTIQFK